jgi:hypothetical protein
MGGEYPDRWRPRSHCDTARHSAQQIAFNESGGRRFMADRTGTAEIYYGRLPGRGLAVARMVGHITYMSDESMREKFGRKLRTPDQFEVESYLKYRGYKFVDRFDANSYILHYARHGYFDLTQRGALPRCSKRTSAILLISFTSDWLYPRISPWNREGAAGPQLRRGVLQSGASLRARFLPGGVEQQTEVVRDSWRAPSGRRRECVSVLNSWAARLRDHRGTDRAGHAVLDLGCGEGELLAWLKENKQVDGAASRWKGRACRRLSRAERRCIKAIWSRR